MVGAWAGEIGQVQFLPADYIESGVDFDGDGRRDLRHSIPDVLASSANLLVTHGWQSGGQWLQEVSVPEELPWQEADIAITHPRSQWAKWGVKARTGKLKADKTQASLLLPMGRNGPAFLAYPNFTKVYLKWNDRSSIRRPPPTTQRDWRAPRRSTRGADRSRSSRAMRRSSFRSF